MPRIKRREMGTIPNLNHIPITVLSFHTSQIDAFTEPAERNNNNNNELYLHDHTSTYSIAKAIFRNKNYIKGQLRYFDNNLSRTSKS